MSLTDRIRAIATDVSQGDTTGGLRQEVEQFKDDLSQRLVTLEENIEQLFTQMKDMEHRQQSISSSTPGNV